MGFGGVRLLVWWDLVGGYFRGSIWVSAGTIPDIEDSRMGDLGVRKRESRIRIFGIQLLIV